MPTNAEIKRWRNLHRRKGREETGCFLAEGRRLVGELISWPGTVVAVLHAEPASGEPAVRDLLEAARGRGVRVEAVAPHTIDSIADVRTPQPVLGIGELPSTGWDDIGEGTILLLDGVTDPGNVGALIRTAVALGAAGVVAVGDCADPWSPKALRSTAGAVFRAPVFRTDTSGAVDELRERGVPIWAATSDGAAWSGSEPPGSIALALGSEAHGLSRLVLDAAERTVAVPLAAGVESLNVAAAGAILLDRLRSRAGNEVTVGEG